MVERDGFRDLGGPDLLHHGARGSYAAGVELRQLDVQPGGDDGGVVKQGRGGVRGGELGDGPGRQPAGAEPAGRGLHLRQSEPVVGHPGPGQRELLQGPGDDRGTATDNVAVSTVALVIQDLGPGGAAPPNNCYRVPQNDFQGSCAVLVPAQGGPCNDQPSCSWSYANIPWQTNHQYLVISSATDAALNAQSSFGVGMASNTFVFDTSTPTVTITTPTGVNSYGVDRSTTVTLQAGTAWNGAPGVVTLVQMRVEQMAPSGSYWTPGTNSFGIGPALGRHGVVHGGLDRDAGMDDLVRVERAALSERGGQRDAAAVPGARAERGGQLVAELRDGDGGL